MKSARQIGAALFLIGMFILFLSFEVANYNMGFFIVGGAMAGIGIYMLKSISQEDEENAKVELDQWKNALVTDGSIIDVDLNQCEIKSNKYREVVEDDYPSKINALDTLVGRDTTEYNHVDQSVIIFNTEYQGEKVSFRSPLINKERITLEFLLADKKSTKIYVDRFDKSNYFFDLDFIIS